MASRRFELDRATRHLWLPEIESGEVMRLHYFPRSRELEATYRHYGKDGPVQRITLRDFLRSLGITLADCQAALDEK